MNLKIGDNIKYYRSKRGMTQEELADFLGVSFQSISKWERGLAYPDIETIPMIANYFEISIDELMGNSRVRTEEKISEYLQEYNRLALICTDESDREKNVLAKKAYAEFPYDWRIIDMYRNSLVCGCDEKNFIDTKLTIRFLCEKIISGCTNDLFRQRAISSMLAISETLDEEEKWLEMLNDDFCLLRGECREDIAFDRGRFSYGLKFCQENLSEYLSWFLMKIDTLEYGADVPDDMKMSAEQKIAVNNKVIDILKIIFECGDYGEWSWNIACKYEENVRLWLYLNKTDEALDCFEKSVEFWLKYDELPEKISYTSLLFNRLEFIKNDSESADADFKNPANYIERINSMSIYDKIRNESRFIVCFDRLKHKE